MTDANGIVPHNTKWRIVWFPKKRPVTYAPPKVKVTRCVLVYKPEDALVCRHCGFDTPIDDTGLRVIFCGNCGQTMVDYRGAENA